MQQRSLSRYMHRARTLLRPIADTTPPILQQRSLSCYMHRARTLLRPIAETTPPTLQQRSLLGRSRTACTGEG